MPLNDNQKRHLLSSFGYVDGLLSEIESHLSTSKADSFFSQYIPDLAPVQQRVIADYVAQIRQQMADGLRELGIALPEPRLSSLWAVRSTLLSIDNSVVEMGPNYMRGYGEVNAETARALEAMVANLQKVLRRLSGFLAEDQEEYRVRLIRLERIGQDTGVLKKLEGAIARYGLVEFRTPLKLILERMESTHFEIALFGRVSSGKSSLLNRLLGTDVLPVGVTPVTALPTRVLYGEAPGLTVVYADRKPEQAPIGRLVDFVSEQGNPGNRRHVARVLVHLPSPRLKEGVVFVDTPGIGSLASSGTAEAMAYMPRCDLGIVLIDAGSTVETQDVRLLRSLYESGTPAMVLISKADLVTEADLDRMSRYIQDHLEKELGRRQQVYVVSTVESHIWRLEQWFEREILPLYEKHRSLAQASLYRKIGHLRTGVVQVLQSLAARSTASASAENTAEVQALLRRGVERVEETRRRCRQIAEGLPEAEAAFVCATAEAIVSQWRRRPRADLGAALRQAAAERLSVFGRDISRAVQELRDFLKQTLSRLDGQVPVSVPLEDLEAEAVTDLPPAEAILPSRLSVGLRLPWWLWWFPQFRRRYAARRVRRALAGDLAPGLETFARQLQAWAEGRISRLEALYDGLAGGARFALRRSVAAGSAGEGPTLDALQADLRELDGKMAERL